MSAFDSAHFQTPPSENAPVYAWPWNGPITPDLIDRELDEILSFGIRSVYVIPMPADFRPNNMRTPLSPGYLTDAFFELIAYAARAAKARDMGFWLYDEGGWPSGSANRRVVALEPDLIRQDLQKKLQERLLWMEAPDITVDVNQVRARIRVSGTGPFLRKIKIETERTLYRISPCPALRMKLFLTRKKNGE